MSLLDPTLGKARVFQSGSFSAHPVTMAAGLAMLEVLTPDVYARLDRLTDRLVHGLEDVFARTGTVATAGRVRFHLQHLFHQGDRSEPTAPWRRRTRVPYPRCISDC